MDQGDERRPLRHRLSRQRQSGAARQPRQGADSSRRHRPGPRFQRWERGPVARSYAPVVRSFPSDAAILSAQRLHRCNMVEIVKPALEHLPSYKAALERGWSPDNVRLLEATREQLAAIEKDPVAFLADLDDPEAKGGPITLPDGKQVPRLPGFRRWIWDGEAAGSIGFRWQPGTAELPPHVLGHIGYAVVPWKRRRGYATEALRLMLGRGEGGRPRPCRDHRQAGQSGVAQGDPGQWRQARRALLRGRRLWRGGEPAVPDRAVARFIAFRPDRAASRRATRDANRPGP